MGLPKQLENNLSSRSPTHCPGTPLGTLPYPDPSQGWLRTRVGYKKHNWVTFCAPQARQNDTPPDTSWELWLACNPTKTCYAEALTGLARVWVCVCVWGGSRLLLVGIHALERVLGFASMKESTQLGGVATDSEAMGGRGGEWV